MTVANGKLERTGKDQVVVCLLQHCRSISLDV
jgi:hypothetical protein